MIRLINHILCVLFGIFIGVFLCICLSPSKNHSLKDIGAKIKAAFPNFAVEKAELSEFMGLYEFQGKNGIIYSDGKHLFVGHVLTMDGQRDLTQEKIDSLKTTPKVDVSAALTVIEGNGKNEVIMITDPECPYCSQADGWFAGSNTTRKILFLPLPNHKSTATVSEHILCSDKPAKEYQRVMKVIESYFKEPDGRLVEYLENNGITIKSCAKGKKQLEDMQDAIAVAGFTGTPMFIVNGKLVEGADPALKGMIQ